MPTVTFQADGLDKLAETLAALSDNVTKEVNTAIWATAKYTKRQIAKSIQSEVMLPQKVIIAQLVEKRDIQKITATVSLRTSRRPGLDAFKPRQNKQGTHVKISRTKGGKTIPGAFMGPKPGQIATKLRGKVMKRVGKERLPIRKLKGPSPIAVFLKNNQLPSTMDLCRVRLREELQKRIRYWELKNSGGLNWQQESYVSDQATGEN